MKKFKIILFIIVAIVLAIPFIAYVAIQQIGTDKLKPIIADAVKQKTGRELVIAGDIGAEFSFTPTLSVEGITLSNPEWAEQPDMVRVKQIRVELDLRSLLQKKISIDSLVLDGADITLIQEASRNSWTFEAQEEAKSEVADDAETEDVKNSLVNLEVGDVTLQNIALHFYDKGVLHNVNIPNVTVQMQPSLEVNGQAIYKDVSSHFTVSSKVSDPTKIMDEALAIVLDTTLPKGTLDVKGTVSDLTDTPTFAGKVNGALASAHYLNSVILDGSLSPTEAIAFATNIKANAKTVSAVIDSASYGVTTVSGKVDVALDKAKPYITANVSVPNYVLPASSGDGVAAPAGDAGSSAAAEPLPLDGLKAFNGDFTVKIGSVKQGSDALASDISLKAKLNNGRLAVNSYRLSSQGGNIAGSAVVNASGETPSYSVNSQLSGFTVERLLKRFTDYNNVSSGAMDVDIVLKSSGATMPVIQNNVDGTISYVLGKTSVAVPASASQVGNFLNILRGKTSQGKAIELSCSVGKFTLTNGVAKTETLLLDTPGAVVSADGSVNINKQTVSMALSPRTKLAGLSDLTIPVRVSGAFSNLKIAPDTKGAVKNLSRIGLSLIQDKSDLTKVIAPALAEKLKTSGLSKTCLNDMPANAPSLTTKEGLKNLEKDIKNQGEAIEDNVRNVRDNLKSQGKDAEKDIRNIRDTLKNDGKNIEKNIRDVRDGLKGLKDLF